MASIIVISGENKGDYYPLGKRTTVIGRSESLPVQIVDPKISRKHFKISYLADSDNYAVADMESKHGLFVNGNRLGDGAVVLNDNDYITAGQTHIMFTVKNFADRENAFCISKRPANEFILLSALTINLYRLVSKGKIRGIIKLKCAVSYGKL